VLRIHQQLDAPILHPSYYSKNLRDDHRIMIYRLRYPIVTNADSHDATMCQSKKAKALAKNAPVPTK
jgi:hypothetical protein